MTEVDEIHCPSGSGRAILRDGPSKKIYLWSEGRSFNQLRSIGSNVNKFTLSHDGTRAALLHQSGSLDVYDVLGGVYLLFTVALKHAVQSFCFSAESHAMLLHGKKHTFAALAEKKQTRVVRVPPLSPGAKFIDCGETAVGERDGNVVAIRLSGSDASV